MAGKIITSVEDQSTRVSSTSSYNAAIVIAAKKGPINVPVKVTGQTDFLRRFTPNERLERNWDLAYYEAYRYLNDQGGLYVVRAAHTVKDPDLETDSIALYGGCVLKMSTSENSNNSLEVGLENPKAYTFQDDDACLIYGADQGAYNNDLAVVVVTDPEQVRLDGAFILKVYKNKVLVETWTCSLDPSMKNGYGTSCFIETVLESSLYVRAISAALDDDGYGLPKAQDELLKLQGGDDGADNVDYITALKTLGNINDIDIQLVWDGGNESIAYKNAINDLCKKREESCHGILSTRYADEVNADMLTAIKKFRNEDLNINSYSVEMYTTHQKYYDEFNDRYIYLSPGPYVCSLIIQTARERGWHWAVAGYNRGIVPSVDVAAKIEPTVADELSNIQVNPIIKDPGAGNVIMDELTMWNLASDLQDAHIARWINIFVRPNLKTMLKSFLFEFNDEETRALLTRKIITFMEPQKAGRACYAYRVVCDETNNLDDDIENNRLNCWLYIKPEKISKEIRQKIILTPYSTNLESLEV